MDRRPPPGYSLPPYDDELDSPTSPTHGAAAVRLLTSVEESVDRDRDRDRPYVTPSSPVATPAFLNMSSSSISISTASLQPKDASKHQGSNPETSTMAFDECPAAASSLETKQEPEMQAATAADDPPPSPSVHHPLPFLDVNVPPPLYIKQVRKNNTAKLHSPKSSVLNDSPNLAEALPTIPEGP
ncbi:uncharacterized protein TRIVIDRAFT_40032, partial [Trichoderma virens Gv29-8]